MAAVPLGIHPNVVLSELRSIGTSAKTQQDRLVRTEARIHQLKAELAQAADQLGWEKPQKDQHIADIVKRRTDAKRLASTEQFAVLDRAVQLLAANANKPPALQEYR
jgi:hypothetical protein